MSFIRINVVEIEAAPSLSSVAQYFILSPENPICQGSVQMSPFL